MHAPGSPAAPVRAEADHVLEEAVPEAVSRSRSEGPGASVASILTRDTETGVWRSLHTPAASDIGHPLTSLVTSLQCHQPPVSLASSVTSLL